MAPGQQAVMDVSILSTAYNVVDKVSQQEEVKAMFEQQGVADELLEFRAAAEARAFSKAAANYIQEPEQEPSAHFPTHVERASTRQVAVKVLRQLMIEVGRSETNWYSILVMLDSFCCGNPDKLQVSSLPALCAALVRLEQKQDQRFTALECAGQELGYRAWELVNELLNSPTYTELVKYLTREDCLESPTYKDVNAMEHAVLISTRWSALPTLADWLNMIGARLDILTHMQYREVYQPVWHCSWYWMQQITVHCAASEDCPPRRIAHGLICIVCVASGLVPMRALGVSDMKCLSSLTMLGCPPVKTLQGNPLSLFLAALSVASDSDLKTMQEDAYAVNDVLLDVFPHLIPMPNLMANYSI